MSKVATVLLITNIPTPYRIPLFNEMSYRLNARGFKLKVLFSALGYSRRKWAIDMSSAEFEYIVLQKQTLENRKGDSPLFRYPRLVRTVRKECPQVIITNAFSLATTKLWLLSYFNQIHYIVWSGAVDNENRGSSILRRIQRRLLIKRASGYIAYGTSAKDYLVSLGAKPDKVQIGINTVDTTYFSKESKKLRNNKGNSKIEFIYVGHFTKGKRLDLLFEAAKLVMDRGYDFCITLLGEGPERSKLEELVHRLKIDSIVHFKGFRQIDEIPAFLSRADCFVFPSEYDVWGLVLVEAMACGIPCLASVKSGATRDLVIKGKTGFPIDFSNTSKVAANMCWIIEHPCEVSIMGETARQFIEENINLQVSAGGFLKAIESCLPANG